MPSSVNGISVTREELRRRIAELLPILKTRAAQTKQLRQIPPKTVQDMKSPSPCLLPRVRRGSLKPWGRM
jgi:hypothetical protein